MSTTTVSITGNPTASLRRLVVAGDEKSGLEFTGIGASPMSRGGEIGVTRDSIHSIERSREAVVQVKRTIASDSGATTKPYRSSRRGGASVKTRWQTVVSLLMKNLLPLILLAGLVQIVRMLYLNSDDVVPVVYSDNFDSRIAEVEAFVKKTMKMMQVQVEVVDRKVSKMEEKSVGIEGELDKLGSRMDEVGGRMDSLEKYLSGNEWLTKGEFDEFFEDFKKARGGNDRNVNLDELMALAREIVTKEIEKHAADGVGRVDYALASGGGFVTRHSEAYGGGVKGSPWFFGTGENWVHADSVKMIRPSFGEPGDCFALKGSSGFVQIKLKAAIIPEAVTLEHVAKSVAYDRSSAPKDCRVSGWFRGQETDLAHYAEKMFSLAEFTYDLEKSNAQTFDVPDSSAIGLVNMIRLDFTSNHGSPSRTCIYRFRVHGHEPDSIIPLALQS